MNIHTAPLYWELPVNNITIKCENVRLHANSNLRIITKELPLSYWMCSQLNSALSRRYILYIVTWNHMLAQLMVAIASNTLKCVSHSDRWFAFQIDGIFKTFIYNV